MWGLLFSGYVVAVVAVLQAGFGVLGGGFFRSTYIRADATMAHPDFLGIFLAMLLPIAFAKLIGRHSGMTRLLAEGGSFVKNPKDRGYGATHFALSVNTDADKVEQIAERAGWHCVTCNRGPFHVIEVWVENDTMVEVLPPEFAAEYLAWTRKDKVLDRMAQAPTAAARHR